MHRELVKPLEPRRGRTRCSYVDLLCVPLIPTLVFAYPGRLDPARMRTALARVLGDFPSFSGRLRRRRGELFIDHGAGAIFETATSEDSCAALGTAVRASHSKIVCPSLSPVSTLLGRQAPFAARLTHASDGSVLGISWSHALCDHHSMMLLLRAWALAYRDRPYLRPVELTDRETYLNDTLPEWPGAKTHWRMLSWPDFLQAASYQSRAARDAQRVVVDFSWSQISAIHAAATSQIEVTPSDALCAHIVRTLRELDEIVSPQFSLTINYRSVFGLPANLICNASDIVRATANTGDDTSTIAANLRANIRSFGKGSLSRRELLHLRAVHPGFLQAIRFWGFGALGHTNLCFTNVSRGGHYSLVFGSSKPTFVHVRPSDNGNIIGTCTVFGSPGGRGLTLEMMLPSVLVQRMTRESSWRISSPPSIS